MHTGSPNQTASTANVDSEATRVSRKPAFWLEILAVVLITLAAAGLRMYKLGYWSWWVDEIFTLRDALDVSQKYHDMTYPLSYILIGAYLKHSGVTEFAARLLPAITGIVSVPLLYLLTRKSFGAVTAIVATCLLAFSPWHLYWSQMARFYTMTMCFGMLGALVFWQALQENKSWKMLAAVVFMQLSIFSHYSGFLLLFGLFTYCVCQIVLSKWERPAGFNIKNLGIFFGILFVIQMIALGRVGFILSKYFFDGQTTGSDWDSPLVGMVYAVFSSGYRIGFGLSLFALITAFYLLRKRTSTGLFLTAFAIIPPLLLAICGILSLGENRYGLVALPAYLILASIGVSELVKSVAKQNQARVLALAAAAALLMPMVQHDMFYFHSSSNGERWNYKAAFQYIMENRKPGDAILTPMTLPLATYAKGSGLQVGKLVPDRLENTLRSGKRYWIVVEDATRAKSAGTSSASWLAQNADLKVNYPASSPVANYSISIYLLNGE